MERVLDVAVGMPTVATVLSLIWGLWALWTLSGAQIVRVTGRIELLKRLGEIEQGTVSWQRAAGAMLRRSLGDLVRPSSLWKTDARSATEWARDLQQDNLELLDPDGMPNAAKADRALRVQRDLLVAVGSLGVSDTGPAHQAYVEEQVGRFAAEVAAADEVADLQRLSRRLGGLQRRVLRSFWTSGAAVRAHAAPHLWRLLDYTGRGVTAGLLVAVLIPGQSIDDRLTQVSVGGLAGGTLGIIAWQVWASLPLVDLVVAGEQPGHAHRILRLLRRVPYLAMLGAYLAVIALTVLVDVLRDNAV